MVIKTYSVSAIACTSSHAGNANVMLCVTASCSIQSSINHITTRILGSLTWQKVQRVLCHHLGSWQVVAVVRIWLGWQKRETTSAALTTDERWIYKSEDSVQSPSTITFAFSLLINLNSLLLTHYYTLPKWSSPSLSSPPRLLWKVFQSQKCAIHLPVLPHWHTSVVCQMTRSPHWPLVLLPQMRRLDSLVQ